MTRGWPVAALAAACSSSHPAAKSGDDLSPKLEAIRAAHELPALAMEIWRGGKLVASGVTGRRKADDATHLATLDDRWHLGSDTKAMTATLIGIYVDRGVLHWTDTIEKLFPDEMIDPGYRSVTLDQLLAHRGGAPAEPPEDLWMQLWADAAKPDARARFVFAMLARPPAQPPGTFAYSNAGYMIAATALERATGKPWEQLMRADLFSPLGITGCGFGPPGDPAKLDQPWGHLEQDGKIVPMSPADPHADNPPGVGPAGTASCTLADWNKFLELHEHGNPHVISAASLAHLHAAPPGDGQSYMGGWMVIDNGGGDVRLAHEGTNTMWHAIALVVPAADVTVEVAANREDSMLFLAVGQLITPYLTRAPAK